MCSSPLTSMVALHWTSFWCIHVLLVLESPGVGAVFHTMSHKGRREGKSHAPGFTLANTAQHTVGLLCIKGALLTHVQLAVHWDVFGFFSAKLLSSTLAFSLYSYTEYLHPRRRSRRLRLDFTELLTAHFFSLSSTLSIAALPTSAWAPPPKLVPSTALL